MMIICDIFLESDVMMVNVIFERILESDVMMVNVIFEHIIIIICV